MKSFKLLLLLGLLTVTGCKTEDNQSNTNNEQTPSNTQVTDREENNNNTETTTPDNSSNRDENTSSDNNEENTTEDTPNNDEENTKNENNNVEENNENTEENNENANSAEDTPNNTHEELSYKIGLYNPSCGTASTEKLNAILKEYINKIAHTSFVTSVTNTSCQISNNIPTDGNKVLIIGAGSKNGSLTFNFASEVKKVTITAQTYFNPYVETWTEEKNEIPNVDSNSELEYYTDGASPIFKIDLKTANDTPVEKTVEIEVNNTTLTLASCNAYKGRVFIKELIFFL